jgi:predicted SnoaL-like aldol condensation-catalyzing enzyme
VLLHGRFTNHRGPRPWIVVDIVHLENGTLAERWDVIQGQATLAESNSGLPVFGTASPD